MYIIRDLASIYITADVAVAVVAPSFSTGLSSFPLRLLKP